MVPDTQLAAQIVEYLAARRGPDAAALAGPPSASPAVIRLRDGFELVKGTGVGFPPEALDAAREAGVEVVARIGNYPGIAMESIEWTLARLRAQGVRNVVFTGTDVLGNKDLLPEVADALLRHGLNFGFVEFGKQRGDADLARRMRGRMVRLHSITDAEMNQMTPPDAADRFAKAARERNIRVLYLRLFMNPSWDLIEANTRYLEAIKSGLQRADLVTGPANPFSALSAGRLWLILVGMGVVAGTVLLLARALALPANVQWALLLLGIFGSSALLGLPPTLNYARKGLALLAALVFPTLALLLFGDPGRFRVIGFLGEWVLGGGGEPANAGGVGDAPSPTLPLSHSPIPPFRGALSLFLKMSAVSLAGALLIVGLLGDTRYMLKYDQFIGVKAAHMLPLFALMLILAGGLFTPAASPRARWEDVKARFRRLFGQPVFVWQVAGVMAAAVVLLLLVARTGNDPGVGVSGLELRFRAILDKVLFVRPRTKEFLIGHPAMLLALWAGLAGWRGAWVPLLLLGAIGQVSLVNTFCHIHMPLMLSVMRAGNGLVVGIILGLLFLVVLRRALSPVAGAGPLQKKERRQR